MDMQVVRNNMFFSELNLFVPAFLLVMTALLSVGTADPKVGMEPYVVLERGTTGLLPCKYEDDVSAVTWSKGPKITEADLLLVYDAFLGTWRTWGPGYDASLYDVTTNYSLLIDYVAMENNGRYFCEVLDLITGRPFINHTDVTVYAFPRKPFPVIDNCEYGDIEERNDRNCSLSTPSAINITCSVSGFFPSIDMTFLHEGTEVRRQNYVEQNNTDGTKNKSITIMAAPSEKPYLCIASKIPGQRSDLVQAASISIHLTTEHRISSIDTPVLTISIKQESPQLGHLLIAIILPIVLILFIVTTFVIRRYLRTHNHGGQRNTYEEIPLIRKVTTLNDTLRKIYHKRNRVPIAPWESRYAEIVTASVDEVYTDLDIYIDINRPDLPVRYHMTENQLFTSIEVKDESGKRKTVIGPSTRVVARGQAGSGKTTFLLKLAMDWANNESQLFHKDETVFLLHMKKFNNSLRLEGLIIDQLLSTENFAGEAIKDFIVKNQRNVVILLDGYDEFKTTESNQQITSLLRKKYLPDVRVLITTRPGKLNSILKLVQDEKEEYRSLQITGFSPTKIDEYVQNVLGENSVQVNTLLNYLADNHLKEELACLPPMCSAMCHLTKLIDMEEFEGMKTITSLLDMIMDRLMNLHSEENYTSVSSSAPESEHSVERNRRSIEHYDFLLELGKVALEGFIRFDEKELIFTYKDFHDSKTQAEKIISKGCKIGILSKEYYELITVYAEPFCGGEDEEPSIKFSLKIIQEKLAAMYLTYLWGRDGEKQGLFMKYLSDICKSYQRATDLGNVLMFSCGTFADISQTIVAKLVGLISAEKSDLHNFITGMLSYERWQEVQRMIELCLRLNYESQSNGKLNDILLPLLKEGSNRIRLVGFSSAVSKYLGYFLDHLDGQHIKSVELRHLHSDSELSFKSYLDTFKELKIAFKNAIAKTREIKSNEFENFSEHKRRWKLYGEEEKSGQIPHYLLMRMGDQVFNAMLPLWQRVNRKQLKAGSIGPIVDGLYKETNIETIILDGVHGNDEDWKRLFTIMTNGAWVTLQRLSIINTHLQGTVMSTLTHDPSTHHNLLHLDLSGNHINSKFLDLFFFMSKHREIKNVNSARCKHGSFFTGKAGKAAAEDSFVAET